MVAYAGDHVEALVRAGRDADSHFTLALALLEPVSAFEAACTRLSDLCLREPCPALAEEGPSQEIAP